MTHFDFKLHICVYYENLNYIIIIIIIIKFILDSFNLACAKMFLCVLEDGKRDC
jgi:hypothetical protein